MGKMPTYTIVQRAKYRGDQTWYLRTCENGKTTYRSLGTDRKKEAQAFLDRMNARRFMPDLPGTGDARMDEIVSGWLEKMRSEHGTYSPTFVAYRFRIAHFARFCSERRIERYSDMTPLQAERFAEYVSDRVAPKTAREILKLARNCVSWAIDAYNLPGRDVFRGTKTPKVRKTRVEFWTWEQIRAILSNAPNDGARALWGLMAYAGLRWSEARNLKIGDLGGDTLTVVEGKGGKTAELPVSSVLRPLLDASICGRKEGLVVPKKAVPMRSDKAMKYLQRAVDAAGIPGGHVSHHRLRHSFASELLRNGVNPRTVQELMRHSSIDTLFDHYAHVLRSDLKDAVEGIG